MSKLTAPADIEDLIVGLFAFIDQVVVPLEEANADVISDPRTLYDESGAYSKVVRELMRQVRQAAAGSGYYGMFAPEEIGGGGLGCSALVRTWEALHHRYGPARLLPYESVAHWSSGPSALCCHFGVEMACSALPSIMDGTDKLCFAMSEPDAGSDAWSMATRAEHNGTSWIINGTKQWISNSPSAKYALVFAVTSDSERSARRGGITCFLVPTETSGFHVDSVIRLFGDVGGNEAILSLVDVRVDQSNVVGSVGRGFDLAMSSVSTGRLYNAGRCVGLARWALERATDYAKSRIAFGVPIASHQGVSFQLADAATDIYAAKSMTINCAQQFDRGAGSTRDLAIVKAFATEMCFRVYDRCIQVHGGMGLTNEMRLYDGWHTARMLRIADGSAEIMRRTIAKALLSGDLQF